jgi:ComF family protein
VAFRRLVSYLTDLVFPTLCTLCETPVKSPPLCESCLADLERIEAADRCDLCAYPLPNSSAKCPHCHGKGIRLLERVVSLGVFHDPLRGMVHRLKYREGWPLAEFLGDRAAANEACKGLLSQTDVLVAIPLHPLRQMSRGYNQADVLAQRIGNRCGIPCLHPIIRLRNTETQTHLHGHAVRAKNLLGAFGLVDEREIAGRHIVLIDDVMTSGSTLISAARTLQQASPASISAIVIAVADPKGRAFEMI